MSNLLDKASIILTPTAYNNGEALCVKPSDGSGDFDFSRNSAATRVNAQGLVENVQSLGSEEIVNGDFSDGSTDWGSYTTGSSTIVFTDVATLNIDASNSNVGIYQENVFTSGKQYKIVLKMKATASFDAEILETQQASTISTIGSVSLTTSFQDFTFYFTATGGNDIFVHRKFNAASANQSIIIDNVSVKEAIDNTNLPRINYEGFSYDGSGNVVPDSGCGSWLFEPQSTNLLPYSEDFSQWSSAGDVTIESGYLAPDGTNNAYKVSGTTSALTLSAGLTTTTTRSIYARTVSGTGQANLLTHNSNTNNLFTITEQWQRFDLNTANATGVNFFYAVDFRGSTNLSEIIIWGANATNDQDYATSYVPSNGSTVTRNQDLCTNGGSLASINSTEGVLYAEITALVDTDVSDRVISLSDNTITNRVELKLTATGSIQGRFDSATSDTTLTKIGISTTNTNKIALYWESGKCALWINGIKEQENLTFNTFASNALIDLSFNSAFSGGSSNFFGKTKCLAVFPILTDAELTELTTI